MSTKGLTREPREKRVERAADELEALRTGDCWGDGSVDDAMLADAVCQIFQRAIEVPGLSGDKLAVLRLRCQSAAFEAVDLMSEDYNRRDLLA